LDWTEPERQPHRGTLQLYRDFLRFRRANLGDRRRGDWQVDQVSDSAIVIRYRRKSAGDILVVAQLLENESVIPLQQVPMRLGIGRVWELVISTNDPLYGGKEKACLDPAGNKIVLTGPELIVLCEQGAANPETDSAK
jgi:hypothetical protein